MKAVCLWSGPRNLSTALMYSFAERPDTRVVDEPLYGHYLRVSGAQHPGRNEVLQAMDCEGDTVIRSLLGDDRPPTELLFIKNMAHHLSGLDLSFLARTRNVLLIRNPIDMLPSLAIQLPHAGIADTGLARQWDLYRNLEATNQTPIVVDARELLLDPAAVLRELCRCLDIPFVAGMLRWPPGPIREDGIWARHWYHAVHKSTGFAKYKAKGKFPEHLQTLLDECLPYYENLYARSIKAGDTGDDSNVSKDSRS